MALGASERCGWCKQERRVAKVAGRPPGICSGCVGLCMDIVVHVLASEGGARESSSGERRALLRSLGVAEGPLDERTIGALDAALRPLRRPAPPSPRPGEYVCSFCARPRPAAAQLVAGAGNFVCDACALRAAALFVDAGERVVVAA